MLTSSPECMEIKYVDCRNWYDFSQQILCLVLSVLLLLHVSKHYRNLKKQKQAHANSEHQKSLRRKIAVNLIQILYLTCFILNTIFDCLLWQMYHNKDSRQYMRKHQIDNVYKLSEVLYINWLNTLNLTVGFLYWKATRAYYVLSDLTVPVLYRTWMKRVFFFCFCVNGSAVLIAFVFLIILDYSPQENMDFTIFTLVSTTISIILCISASTLYRHYILTKVQLSPSAIKKQKTISILLFISSILRIAIYSLDINTRGADSWIENMRNQVMDQEGRCVDQWGYYTAVLFVINVGINLLPAAIYAHLFVSEVDMKLKASRDHRLIRNDSQYS